MTAYRYVAVAPDGKQIKAAAEATSEEVLRTELLLRNLEVRKISEQHKFTEIELTKKRVKPAEVMHFSRQIAAFVRSGIPLADALEVVEDNASNKRWRSIVVEMREAIQNGVPFSDAVAAHGEVFPPYYLGILRSSEFTGQLDVALDQLAGYMERDLEARQQIKSALTYPTVIGVMSIVTVAIMATYVLPKFAGFFDSLDSQLPLPTRMLLAISGFMKRFWYAVPLSGVFVGVMIYLLRKTEPGRSIRDKVLLKVPLIREIVLYAVVERFGRIVGAMVRAGVPITDAMAAAIRSVHNKVFEKALQGAQERMMEGEGISAPLRDLDLFPRAAIQMMRVGEDTGTLDIQLENAAAYYGSELNHKLKRLTSLFEPAVIIFMGAIVGFVAVALISAMYGVFQGQELGG